MLSSSNIEGLIAEKRREIEREKTVLGLSPPPQEHDLEQNVKTTTPPNTLRKQVSFSEDLSDHNGSTEDQKEKEPPGKTHQELDDRIPPDLERYIRRYIGIPVMLKAGEYSPNNPLVRGERGAGGGDAFLGLGEYERRRNTLRKIRQQQYREYLDQQAKKKQEAKQQAERERREREQKEKEREEREREILIERDRYSAERRRSVQYVPETAIYNNNNNKVDTGVQVDGFTCPLSVAVQTDDNDMYRLGASPTKSPQALALTLTQAERELSPRSAHAWPAGTADHCARRRSYGDFDERTSSLVQQAGGAGRRQQYKPSILDADAIQLRNMQAEKEAAERRQFYQQELKNQILEQQRIREERKTREKMLEQAEMRRLEEQLRMLRVAQDRELGKQHHVTAAIKESTTDYHAKRAELQRDIDAEQRNIRAASQPHSTHYTHTKHNTHSTHNSRLNRNTNTSQSDTHSKLPFYYPRVAERTNDICAKKPYSINIPDNSIFSSNYDVDSYLRKNLNFNKEKPTKYEKDDDSIVSELPEQKTITEKALVHASEDRLTDRPEKPSYMKTVEVDTLPIPVLRHSPKRHEDGSGDNQMSEAMRKVDDKYKVPAVQKNILKALPNEEGKSVNILTQLGSIRRQLQLEQLKLDKMITNDVE